jgi:putative ABC transport system ATP-binding protein
MASDAFRFAVFFMITLQNVSKTVRSGAEDLTILDDVSLVIPDGEFVSVTGASGSGKSTLLGLIAGIDAPTTGSILIDGEDITKMSEDNLADVRSHKIGFIFQSFHLIPSLTAFEIILIPMEILGLKDAKPRAEHLLADVELTNRGHHYPSELWATARTSRGTPRPDSSRAWRRRANCILSPWTRWCRTPSFAS